MIYENRYNAERALLGSLLLNGKTISKISQRIKTEHFRIPMHKKIYDVLCVFDQYGWPTDVVSVADQMSGNDNTISQKVLLNMLGRMVIECPSAKNVWNYAKLVDP